MKQRKRFALSGNSEHFAEEVQKWVGQNHFDAEAYGTGNRVLLLVNEKDAARVTDALEREGPENLCDAVCPDITRLIQGRGYENRLEEIRNCRACQARVRAFPPEL
ncbi:MAG TPA: hypothetical protein PLO37_12315 [Candidatus Hydrogenedentes bacterium]|nr:hypothetical protein [Candidatus Hydrogenedentota bacterium]HPG67626.1 hypothetical protein [Candidatus Hydrogenedentota bacterium]